MFPRPTIGDLASVTAQAARLAIQLEPPAPGCPARLTVTAQALLDQGLGPVEVDTVLRSMTTQPQEHAA